MEADANKACANVGASFHKVEDSAQDAGKGVGDASGQMRLFGNEANKAASEADQFSGSVKGGTKALADHEKQTKKAGDEHGRLQNKVSSANATLALLGKTIKIIKWPALIAGAGAAAAGISALTAGAIALTSALAPLAGAGASVGQTFIAVKQGMGVAKLAMTGTEGATKDLKKQLDMATPAANNFKKQIQGLTPELVHMRNLAQGPILRGLMSAIDRVKGDMPIAAGVIRKTAETLGVLADNTGKFVHGNAAELGKIGSQNAVIIGRMGSAGLHLAGALVTILRAAAPLTGMLSKMAQRWAANVEVQTKAADANGQLSRFFDRTGVTIKKVIAIVSNLGHGLIGLFAPGYKEGQSFLTMLVNLTAKFRAFTTSFEGQNKIKAWIESARTPLLAFAGLIGDIGKAFGQLGGGNAMGTLTQIINGLRPLIPVLTSLIASTTAALGPQLISTITALAQAFQPLLGSSGPLLIFLKGLELLAKAAAAIQQSVPGASQAMSVFGGSVAVLGGLGLTKAASELFGMRKGLDAVKQGASTAKGAVQFFTKEVVDASGATGKTRAQLVLMRAQSLLMAAGQKIAAAATTVWTVAQKGLNVVLRANPIGLVITALVLLGTALVVAYKKSETFRNIVNGVWRSVRDTAESVFHAIVGTVRSAWDTIKGIFSGNGIKNAINAGLRTALGPVVGFVNAVLSVIDKIPGVNPGRVSVPQFSTGGGGGSNIPAQKLAEGGIVRRPTVIMGEEAPKHPEWVIPENPAYRKRAQGLWAAAGANIGMLAEGGKHGGGGFLGSIGGAIKDVASGGIDLLAKGGKALLGALPKNPLTGTFKGLGSYILAKAGGFIKDQATSFFTGGGGGGGKLPKGIAGSVGSAVNFAHGLGFGTPSPAQLTGGKHAAGSLHYAGRAVDFGDAGHTFPQMDRLWKGLQGRFGSSINELFYDKEPYYIDRHQIQKGQFGGHGDHIHIGFAQGGIMGAVNAARSVGLSGRKLVEAVAIAGAETNWNKDAENLKYPDHSIGYWQINQLAHKGKYGSDAALHNPRTNARAMKAISSNGSNWSPWSTFTNGAWRGYVDRARRAVLSSRKSGNADVAPGTEGGGGANGAASAAAQDRPDPRLNFRTGPGGQVMARGKGAVHGVGTSAKTGQTGLTFGRKPGADTPLGAAVRELITSRAALDLARQDPNDLVGKGAKIPKVASYVPKAVSKALRQQENVAEQTYAAAMKEVRRLEARQKKTGLGPKGREKLKAAYEAASNALGQINSAREAIQAANEEFDPLAKQMEVQDAALAQAGLTTTIWDDIGLLMGKEQIALQQYNQALATHDPNKIGTAATALQQARDAVKSATPTVMDYYELMLEQAKDTFSASDDFGVLLGMQAQAMADYQASFATGDPRQISAALQRLHSIQDSLKQFYPSALDIAQGMMVWATSTPSINDDISYLQNAVNAAYSEYTASVGNLPWAEQIQRLQTYLGLKDQLKQLTPKARDYAELQLQQAQATSSYQDDLAALRKIEQAALQSYNEALATNDPRQIKEALADLQGIQQQIKDIQPTALDFAELALTRAQMTDTQADDIEAWKQIVAYRQKEYDEAMASGDPRKIKDALQNLKDAKDSLDALTALPNVLQFSQLLPPDFLSSLAASFGGQKQVNVQQVYTNPPKDQLSNFRQAEFAANAVFGR